MKYYSLPQKIRSLRAKLGKSVSNNTFVDISPAQAYVFAKAIDDAFKVSQNYSKYAQVKVNPKTLRK